VTSPDVAIVSPFPTIDEQDRPTPARLSGVAAYVHRLAGALDCQGLCVEVLAPEEVDQPARSRSGRVTVRRCYRRGPNALLAAGQAARASRARVVHVQHEAFLYGGLTSVAALAPALAALRHSDQGPVVTMHQVVDPRLVDSEFTRLHRVRLPHPVARAGLSYVQRCIRRFAAATVVHERAFGSHVPGATVVPLGVDDMPRYPANAAKAELGLSPSRLTALCFGYLAPSKGLETALEAARLAGPEVELVVAGGDHPRLAGRDPYGIDLRRRFGDLARFPGYVAEAEVARWFAAADVVLLPYPRPFASSGPYALALGSGTPPLCSPALARTLDVPAELVAPADPAGLAERLGQLARDPVRLERAAMLTEALAVGRSWEDVARTHVSLYEEVIHADRTSRGRLWAGQLG
jgi:glycosyltransferase involved in cell wall biosynthesis